MFLTALAVGPAARSKAFVLQVGAAAAEAVLLPEAESTTGKTEGFWTKTGKDELAAAAAEGLMVGVSN